MEVGGERPREKRSFDILSFDDASFLGTTVYGVNV